MKANLSNHDYIAAALFDIADHYGRINEHEKARQLYLHVADNHRKDDVRTMWAQMRVVMSNISLDIETASQAAPAVTACKSARRQKKQLF